MKLVQTASREELALWLRSQDRGWEHRSALAGFPACPASAAGSSARPHGGSHLPSPRKQGSWNRDRRLECWIKCVFEHSYQNSTLYTAFHKTYTQEVLLGLLLIQRADISGKIRQDFSSFVNGSNVLQANYRQRIGKSC